MIRMIVRFHCPECGNSYLEERASHAVIGAIVEKIGPPVGDIMPVIAYGPTDVYSYDSSSVYYRCPHCGYILCDEEGDEIGPEKLFEWLEQRGMLEPEKLEG